ncbi:T9SS type A sorting domain-containing protein [Winogradskyella forsetii]|uniref:T9SS type A sorting domain-containing protein n=1 Tax=Winogradskyella forsetii TaxID=2686077 RepID=UPI0015BDC2D7|nr:T9SS type A sorting domain-containing protein [Winogradskyella forsetii]
MIKIVLTISAISLSIFTSYAQGWGQTQKIVPSDRALGDFFGQSVAMDGDYAVVGAYWDNLTSSTMGSAYVYKKDTNGNWIEHQKLTASDKRQFDQFGEYVDIDGNFIIVGARGQAYDASNNNFENSAGAAYIFENDGNGNWIEVQKIVSSDRGETFQSVFGQTVAIGGNYAVVAALRESTGLDGQPDLNQAGACYIFERDTNGVWIEVQKIVSSDRDAGEQFGEFALDVYNNTIIVGSLREGLDASGENELQNAGAVYVFERDVNGFWNETQKLVASDRDIGDVFGRAVAIDGDNLVVGADLEDSNGSNSGSVYIFEKDGNGIWNEVQKLTSSSSLLDEHFGQRVDIDGERVVIGAWLTHVGEIGDGGAAYIFEKDGTGFWNETALLYDPNANNGDYFGFSVAISGDYAFVSANSEEEDENNENTLQDAGSAFIFNINEPNTLPPLNTLSILGSDLETSIVAFPNPNQGNFTINLGNTYKQITYSVTNSLGQEIQKYQVQSSNKLSLNIDSERGIYFVNVSTDEGKSTVLKIIKQY